MKPRPKKILIAGYYGFGNSGDEAILTSMLDALRNLRRDLDFTVVSGNPHETAPRHSVNSVSATDIPAVFDAVRQADLVILGGGGLFQDYWEVPTDTLLTRHHGGIPAYAGFPLLAMLYDKPLMLYAVGVGPLFTDDGRRLTSLAVSAADIVTVRDNGSLDELRALGVRHDRVRVTADPAFALRPDLVTAREILASAHARTDGPLVGVCLRSWKIGITPNGWQKHVAIALDQFAQRHNASLVFVPFQTLPGELTDDLALAQTVDGQLSSGCTTTVLRGGYSPEVLAGVLSACDLVLGMRLHSLIFAFKAHVPSVGLVYDPKVAHLMELLGMEAHSLPLSELTSRKLAESLGRAWSDRTKIKNVLAKRVKNLQMIAEENARLAITLLEQNDRRELGKTELDFIKELVIQKSLQVETREKAVQALSAQITEKDQVIQTLTIQAAERDRLQIAYWNVSAELSKVYRSNFWKLASFYYTAVKESPLRFPYRFMKVWHEQNFWAAFRRILDFIHPSRRYSSHKAVVSSSDFINKSTPSLTDILDSLSSRSLKSLFIVTSAFHFDELFNQRIINLAKFLAGNGHGVLYVAWRWSKAENIPREGEEVYPNVFQVPVDQFLEDNLQLERAEFSMKYFVVQFPHPDFLLKALQLKATDVRIVYEIVDNWEEFHKVGQAPWYDGAFEEALIMNSNTVTAVTQPLIDKFSKLRHDIHLVPNGFAPDLLGMDHRNIARRNFQGNEINLGYFGHLTSAWFDWDLIFETLDLSAGSDVNPILHLIGYGETKGLQRQLAKYGSRIRFYGKVHPAELHTYVRTWDIGIIPFRQNKLSESVDPIKFYEYMHFGLPVIVSGIQHLGAFPFVHLVSNAGQLMDVIRELRESPEPYRFDVVEGRLSGLTWDQRFARFLSILESNERCISL